MNHHRVHPNPTRCRGSRAARHVLSAALLAVLAACGSEGGETLGPEIGDLSQAEANSMFSALVTAVGLAPSPTLPSIPGGGGSALVPVTTLVVDTTQTTSACPAGGSVSVLSLDSLQIVQDGRVNPAPDTTYTGTVDFSGQFDITSNYQSCGSTDSSGTVWTFDANPGLNLLFDFSGSTNITQLTSGVSVTTWNLNWDGTWNGTIGWQTGGRSGQCAISVQWTVTSLMSATGTSGSTNQTGTVCGINVTRTT